jgi:DNA-binding protein
MVAEKEILIGSKENSKYLHAIRMQTKMYNEVILKARGKNISKAVDISQIIQEEENIHVLEAKIGTDRLPSKENNSETAKVSFIEIIMKKNESAL